MSEKRSSKMGKPSDSMVENRLILTLFVILSGGLLLSCWKERRGDVVHGCFNVVSSHIYFFLFGCTIFLFEAMNYVSFI